MKKTEIVNYFKSKSWKVTKDPDGHTALYQLSDRLVRVYFQLRNYPDEQQLWISRSVSTEVFYKAYAVVRGAESAAILVSGGGEEWIRAAEILETHVQNVMEEAIAWAKEQNIETALYDCAALPTDCPGTNPIRHLAALAVLGDIARLKSYQASFASGDRLGFVPYINKAHVDRAIQHAELIKEQT